ncbi:DnaB-like helicase N-terminal domain-containing protein [Pyramidobacter piscolens]|uniref:DnaB-like helicase N-terminal domain-containing protein n=1 Tax=Pyramidobacter piscolens TaxID=638849 RepID=UPI002AB16FB3|nr:DnaB-like helicase N-terminal domain-containing protein [Pyramidobacter piscolens]
MPDGLRMPSSAEAERAVIGVMLLDGEAAGSIAAQLEPEDFYDGKNYGIFKTLSSRLREDASIDMVVLISQGILSQSDYASYVDSCTHTGAWAHQAKILRELRQRREIIVAAGKAARAACKPDCDVSAVLQQLGADCGRASRLTMMGDASPDTILRDYAAEVQAWKTMPFVRSGIDRLDAHMGGGILPGQVLTVVGGEGTMKTSLALQYAETYLREIGRPVLYLSLDMPRKRIAVRRLLALMDMPENKVLAEMQGDTPFFQQALRERERFDRGRFLLEGGPMQLKDIEAAVSAQNPGLVIWDFLTATAGYDSEMECQRACANALRAWQTKYAATWIILSQMSEQSKYRQRQGDFGASASGGNSIARVSDTVIELVLSAATPTTYQQANNIHPAPDLIAIISKSRAGQKGGMWALEYVGKTMTFTGRCTQAQLEKPKKSIFSVNF